MAKIALYRKYRPRTFSELFGQDHIAKTLKNSVAEGSFSHAYLFAGPRGTGKTSAARILAKAINCLDLKDGDPCNKCENCLSINDQKAVDIIEIDAASHTQVDNIREIIVERAKFAPTTLKYKVYIIDEAHMLSKSSFNALLKTLEEPPAHTIFILATTEAHKIIPTIQSRCQKFDFRKIESAPMKERLGQIVAAEKIKVSDEALDLIIKSSEGGFRDAISLLDQVVDASGNEIDVAKIEALVGTTDLAATKNLVEKILSKDTKGSFELLHQIIADGVEPTLLYRNVIEMLRLVTLEIATAGELPKDFNKTKDPVDISDAVRIMEVFVDTQAKFRGQPLPALGLEIAVVKATKDLAQIPLKSSKSIAKETEKAVSAPARNLSADAKWQHFLLEVKSKNNSIHAVLKVCEPVFEGKTLNLSFPYKFHKERIEDHRNMDVVASTLEKVYGEKYTVKCILRPSVAISKRVAADESKDDLLADAVDIFGGEVIE